MVRRIADDLEGPARDPSGDNYYARKLYVDQRLLKANNLNDLVDPAAARANLAAMMSLAPTVTKTVNYTAVAGEMVKADATAGPITITIPAPSVGALVGVRKMDATSNPVTVTDGAGTSFNLRIPDEGRILIGQSSSWFTAFGIQTMSGLDSRYQQVPAALRTVNPSAGFIVINADSNGNTIRSTLNGAAELSLPTGGYEDQVLQGIVLAATTQRVLTFATGFGRLAPIASTLTIPAGKIARYALRRTDLTGTAKWMVESVGVEQ